jgi:LPXTG-motif cell wall-anchored protein
VPGPVKIVVTENPEAGTFDMTAEIDSRAVMPDKMAKLPNANGIWKLILQNTAGYELPSTGGPGTKLLFILGIMLMSFAGIGTIILNRRMKTE